MESQQIVPATEQAVAAVPAADAPVTDQERWLRVKERLRAKVGEAIFESWFARMDLERVTNSAGPEGKNYVVHLSVPTRFLKSWIQAHWMGLVLECWRVEQPAVIEVGLIVRSVVIRTAAPKQVSPAEAPKSPSKDYSDPRFSQDRWAMYASLSAGHDALGGSPLDLRYTFESFVVGRANTLAHAAVKQVAMGKRGEPTMFNPLYIHAGVGLGKTHLLHSLVWESGKDDQRKTLYFTAEKFMYGYVSALRTQAVMAYKEALRSVDVLVIDDLQFLQGKSIQAEFCHTINACIDAGRQVVIAADRPPSDLESFDDRVRSRLAGGLVIEMGPLGEDLRLEILKMRVSTAKQYHPGFEVSEPVLACIARALSHSGRDLDGAVNRLLAHNKLTGQPVSMELAEREIRDMIRPQEPKRVKVEDIQRIVARQYNISRADLLSSRRTANVVRPRQVAMYLAKTMTLRSLPEIGRRFGGRDHTTVLHAVRKIERLVGDDNQVADEVETLKRQLLE
jgi:chromosomal replication initiator protein